MAMFTADGGALYTTRERRMAPSPLARKAHKMAEWKVDWWLGREVRTRTGRWLVVGATDDDDDVPKLMLHGKTDDVEAPRSIRVGLATANTALRKGDWSLL